MSYTPYSNTITYMARILNLGIGGFCRTAKDEVKKNDPVACRRVAKRTSYKVNNSVAVRHSDVSSLTPEVCESSHEPLDFATADGRHQSIGVRLQDCARQSGGRPCRWCLCAVAPVSPDIFRLGLTLCPIKRPSHAISGPAAVPVLQRQTGV